MHNFKLSHLVYHLNDIICACDTDYSIKDFNDPARLIFSQGAELIDAKCYQIFRDRSAPCPDCPLQSTKLTGHIIPVNYYDTRLNLYFQEHLEPIPDEKGEIEGFILIVRNITELKEIEDKSAKAKKMAAIGRISSGIAHDFNNVLTGVQGQIELMKFEIEDPSILDRLKMIELAVQTGVSTIRRMKEFTRDKEGQPFELVNLNSVLEAVIDLCLPRTQELLDKNGVQIEFKCDIPEDLTITGSRAELYNAFTNIIFNSIDAMPLGGVISISAIHSVDTCILTFTDTGIGMTDETLERVFDPFFTTKGVKGTGLGLSEAFGVINRHNGKISMSSEPGKGSITEIILPIDRPTEVPKPKSKIAKIRKLKILTVDDSGYVLDVIKDLLIKLGNEVHAYLSAEKALEVYSKNDFDMVITDYGMPEMSGDVFAAKIREMNPHAVIVLLSGWVAGDEDEEISMDCFDLVITKPFTLPEIKKLISDAVEIIDAEN